MKNIKFAAVHRKDSHAPLRLLCIALALCLAAASAGCGKDNESTDSEASYTAVSPAAETDSDADDTTDENTGTAETAAVPEAEHIIDVNLNVYGKDTENVLGDYADEFASFADALSQGSQSYSFSGEDAMKVCLGAVSDLTVYDYIDSITTDGQTVNVVYNTDGIPQKLNNIENYTQNFAAEYYSEGMTDLEICAQVYRFTASLSYDDEIRGIEDVFSSKNCSDFSCARIFVYLLRQFGIDSRILSCTLTDGSLHYLPCVKLDDKFYAFDPVLESGEDAGKGLNYFMMSTSRAKACGLGAEFNCGRDGYFKANFSIAVDTSKDTVFSDSIDWSLDSNAHFIYISKIGDNSGEFSVSFNTSTYTEVQ